MLEEALRWDFCPQMVFYSDPSALPTLPKSAQMVPVPEELLSYIAATETPQKVVFLCGQKPLTLPERLEQGQYLILDGLQDPGNVGTIWRTADAFGAKGIIAVNHCADFYSPKTVRATMGAVFRFPVWESSLQELGEVLLRSEIPLYATALRDDTLDVRALSGGAMAVVIGSEGKGISEEALSLCQKTIKIPMRERCESLNAAVAASVVLWEWFRNQ